MLYALSRPQPSPLLGAISTRGGPSLPARLQASAARRRLKLAHGVVRPCLRARIGHNAQCTTHNAQHIISTRGGPSLPARLRTSSVRHSLEPLAHGVVRPCLRARIEHGAYL